MTRRDSQRSALYSWEESLPGHPGKPLTLIECKELIHYVWDDIGPGVRGQHPPAIEDGRARRSAAAWSYKSISLPRALRDVHTCLHEVAHCIVNYYKIKTTPLQMKAKTKTGFQDALEKYEKLKNRRPHGRLFAAVYLELLRRYAGVDAVKARRIGVLQRPRRVRFATKKEAREVLNLRKGKVQSKWKD